ncbi:syntaxin, Qa-SNARE family [Hepatocystis sp. ex Piliocolobus tephrosceles]|nr:syntaxin, Qa-SNARE family [Hepatocystis sp. ex Piliocolobus tephrosceles]
MEVICRNMTNTYFDYRKEIKKKENRFKLSVYEQLNDEDSGKENLLKYNKNIEMQEQNLLPPYWIETTEEISEDLENIKLKLMELQKMQKDKIYNVLKNTEQLDEDIYLLSSRITVLIKECEKRILTISNANNIDEQSGIVERLKKNVKDSLIFQLQIMSQAFHKKQKNYIKELKKLSNEYDQIQNYEENNTSEQEFIFKQENKQTYINIKKENSDLKKIADTVIDLHNIFNELSIMLVDQGSLLDQIDHNMNISLDKSEQGLNKLKLLHKRETSKRAAKCISFLTSFIFVLLILIIIKHLY